MRRFRQFFEVQVAQHALKQKIGQAADILRSIVNPMGRKMMSDIPKAHDVTTKFWMDRPFLEWLKSHGVMPKKLPPDFKDGGAGRAYFVDPFVVKFTGNAVEAHVAQMVAGRNDLPAPVLAVRPMGGNLFAILEHKVKMGDEIDKNIRDAADWVTAVVDEHPEMTGFPNDPAEQRSLIEETGAPANLFPYMMMVMEALAVLYHATGFKHDDAGPTNVGMHQGKIVFPDLGPNQTGDFSVDRAMDQIGQNRKSLGLDG